VALERQTVALLRAHQNQQRLLRTDLGLAWSDDDLVFAHFDGRPLRPDSITRAFRNTVLQAGLSKITLHGLRHTWGAHAVAEGVHPVVVAKALGHSGPGLAMRMYSPFLPGVDEEAVRRVARSMHGDSTPEVPDPGQGGVLSHE